MRFFVCSIFLICLSTGAHAQLEVELSFKRPQYVAHEAIIGRVRIENHTGRAVDLENSKSHSWLGFAVNTRDGRLLTGARSNLQPTLHLEPGEIVIRRINLTSFLPLHDVGAYHVQANIYLAELDQFFSSSRKVIQVADGRSIWEKTVGVPDGTQGGGETRTYSLVSYRFPDRTSLYVKVASRDRGVVTTRSLGSLIAYDQPQTELDGSNQLHVLHCAAPQRWAYSHIDVNGRILKQSMFVETKTRPRLQQAMNGSVSVIGGRLDLAVVGSGPASGRTMSPQLLDPATDE